MQTESSTKYQIGELVENVGICYKVVLGKLGPGQRGPTFIETLSCMALQVFWAP